MNLREHTDGYGGYQVETYQDMDVYFRNMWYIERHCETPTVNESH
jgi:hypothetical protein